MTKKISILIIDDNKNDFETAKTRLIDAFNLFNRHCMANEDAGIKAFNFEVNILVNETVQSTKAIYYNFKTGKQYLISKVNKPLEYPTLILLDLQNDGNKEKNVSNNGDDLLLEVFTKATKENLKNLADRFIIFSGNPINNMDSLDSRVITIYEKENITLVNIGKALDFNDVSTREQFRKRIFNGLDNILELKLKNEFNACFQVEKKSFNDVWHSNYKDLSLKSILYIESKSTIWNFDIKKKEKRIIKLINNSVYKEAITGSLGATLDLKNFRNFSVEFNGKSAEEINLIFLNIDEEKYPIFWSFKGVIISILHCISITMDKCIMTITLKESKTHEIKFNVELIQNYSEITTRNLVDDFNIYKDNVMAKFNSVYHPIK